MALPAPPFPPGIASDPTLYLGIWLAGDPDVAELPAGFAVADKSAITVDGAAGVYFASTERLAGVRGGRRCSRCSVTITGTAHCHGI